MSKLSAFLHPIQAEDKEVFISKRFLDEEGNPVPFKIRAIPQSENDKLVKLSTKTYKENGQKIEVLDKVQYSRRLIVSGTVEPDFSAKEMCDAYKTLDPLEVPGKMLLAGEYQKLADEIATLSEIGTDIEEEAKN